MSVHLPPSANVSTRVLVWGACLCLAASLVMFAYGVIHTGVFGKAAWTRGGVVRLVLVSSAFWLGALAAWRWLGSASLPGAIALGLLLVAASAQFPSVAAIALLFLSAWSLGDLLLSKGRWTQCRPADHVVQLATGLGILSWALGLLALVRFAYPFTYFAVLVLPLAFRARYLIVGLRAPEAVPSAPPRVGGTLLTIAVGNLVLVFLLCALLPEVGSDALSQHLATAAYLRNFGNWHFDPMQHILGLMPIAGDIVYAASFILAGEFAAKLTNYGCFLLLLILVYTWVRETASRSLALLATLGALSSPLVLMEANSLFIENPWSLFLVCAFVAVVRLRERPDPANLYAAAIVFGAAMAAKMLAAAAAPVLLLAAWTALRHDKRLRPHLLAAIALGLLVAAPAYVIAFIKSGNPVFPFFNSIFRSPLYPSEFDYKVWAGDLDPRFLYRATFWTDRYLEGTPGAIGFLPLLLAPLVVWTAAVSGQWRDRVLVAGLLSFTAILIGGSAYVRYLYPMTFLLSMLLGTSIASLWAVSPRLASVASGLTVIAAVAGLPFMAASTPQAQGFRVSAVFVDASRDEFIRDWAPQRRIVERINLEPLADGKAAFLTPVFYTFDLKRRFTLLPTLQARVAENYPRDDVARVLADQGVGYVVTDSATPPALQRAVQSIGTLIMEHGAVRLYRFDDTALLSRETLVETEPRLPSQHWSLQGSPTSDPVTGVPRVSSRDLLYQMVPVRSDARHVLEVSARCADDGAIVRLQIVWFDKDKKNISGFARDDPCDSHWKVERAAMLSPANAAYATVALLAATPAAIEVNHASLRSR